MPSGLENAEMNAKLSPTTGHPKVPGMSSIAFGEAHDCSNTKDESRNTNTNTKMLNIFISIANVWSYQWHI